MPIKLKLSVHQLVDFLLRTGDIDDRIFNNATMLEGTKIHSFYQAKQGGSYISEYHLEHTFICGDYEISLDGRADGVIISSDGKRTIDEIKSTVDELENFYKENKEWHLGQAKCYALMYAIEQDLDEVGVSLTYIHQVTKEEKVKRFTYSFEHLEKYVNKLLKDYIRFYEIINTHKDKRDETANEIKFPFDKFRKGQKELAKYCYSIAKNGGVLFAEAPTGIGKTMSTLFPFVKAFKKEETDKIFYLTAKNSGKEAAFNAIKILKDSGVDLSAINISAKEKICPHKGAHCNPDECPLTKGYFRKVRYAIEETLEKEELIFDREDILNIALNHEICPFEFSLDLSLYLDIIVCDYNYFFDPNVYFRRYFEEENKTYLLLVDEGHNLVERGRDMYTSQISLQALEEAKKSLRHFAHTKLKRSFTKLTKLFESYKGDEEGSFLLATDDLVELSKTLDNFIVAYTDVSKNHHNRVTDELIDFFFDANRLYKLIELFNENFAYFVTRTKDDIVLKIYCLDPSEKLRESFDSIKGAVIFSATLSPSDYYKKIIYNKEDVPFLKLRSPYPKDNLEVIVANKVSLRYKDRDESLDEVVNLIKTTLSGKVGNYFIYVPSYEYQNKIRPMLEKIEDIELVPQERDMNELEKEQFLSMFRENPTKTTVGLLILGGAFSEGIDLVSDRLIGVIIVGVGLPQLCFERDLIREHFDKEEEKLGFSYAYRSPGMNRVMQAVGRVIRSEEDRGIALLIDDRYLQRDYQEMFRSEWSHFKVAKNSEELEKILNKFYKSEKK